MKHQSRMMLPELRGAPWAAAVALASFVGACVIGPKQEDPLTDLGRDVGAGAGGADSRSSGADDAGLSFDYDSAIANPGVDALPGVPDGAAASDSGLSEAPTGDASEVIEDGAPDGDAQADAAPDIDGDADAAPDSPDAKLDARPDVPFDTSADTKDDGRGDVGPGGG